MSKPDSDLQPAVSSLRTFKIAFQPRHRRQASRRAEREEGLRTPHPARVARLLALAHDIEARIEAGELTRVLRTHRQVCTPAATRTSSGSHCRATAVFRDYADVARAHGLTRARLTQVMSRSARSPRSGRVARRPAVRAQARSAEGAAHLLLLAPPIQEDVLHLEVLPGREPISERDLRRVLQSLVWEEQATIGKAIQ